MSYSKPEQLDRQGGKGRTGYRKYTKKATNRLMRRKAKRDPANAPKKTPYFGYE